MTREEYNNLLNAVELNDHLEVVNTTSERDGYPRNINDAIIGFKDWEEAQTFAQENNLDLIQIDKKDGWQLWHRGGAVYEPFDIYSSYLDKSDGRPCFTQEDAQTYIEVDFLQTLQQMLEDGELTDFDDVHEFTDRCEVIYSDICNLDDDEFLAPTDWGNGYERKKKYAMGDYEDTKHIVIAAICDDFDEDYEE